MNTIGDEETNKIDKIYGIVIAIVTILSITILAIGITSLYLLLKYSDLINELTGVPAQVTMIVNEIHSIVRQLGLQE